MELFNVIFQGNLVDGYEVEQAKNNIAKLYKVPTSRIASWFLGRDIVVKKEIDYRTALKCKKILERAGIVCIIKPIVNEKTNTIQADQTPISSAESEIVQEIQSKRDSMDLSQTQETHKKHDNNHYSTKSKAIYNKIFNKKKFIYLTIFIIVVTLSFMGVKYQKDQKLAEERRKQELEELKRLEEEKKAFMLAGKEAFEIMFEVAFAAEEVTNKKVKQWINLKEVGREPNDNFFTKSTMEGDGFYLEMIHEGKSKLDKIILKLKRYPTGMERHHKIIMELYDEFNILCDLALTENYSSLISYSLSLGETKEKIAPLLIETSMLYEVNK